MADRWARAAADRTAQCSDSDTPGNLLSGASLSYMTRTATEARSRASAEWIEDHVRAERQYKPPPERDLRRRHLRRTRNELAGRPHQFLSDHANIGSYLHGVNLIDDDRCWWCDTGKRQTRFHLVARYPAWRAQAKVMWRRVAKLCE